MASIGEITQAASYRGDQNLGGGLGVGVTLDTSPLQKLATFAFYKRRDDKEKKERDDKLIADKIAAISAFDVTSPLKPYTDDLKIRLEKLRDHIKKPNALSYDKGGALYQETLELVGDFQNRRKKATANGVLYEAAKTKGELDQNTKTGSSNLKLLDLNVKDLFKNGIDDAYNRQLRTSPDLNPETYKIPELATTDVFKIDDKNGNYLVVNGRQVADIDRLNALSAGIYNGLGQNQVNVDSQEFKNLSDDEKERIILQQGILNQNKDSLDHTAATIDGLVKQAKLKLDDPLNPSKSITDLPDAEIAKLGSIGSYISSAKAYNKQVDEINAATGKNYEYVNLDNGATPVELINIEFFNKNGKTLYKELEPKVLLHDNELQRQRLGAEWARIGLAKATLDKANQEDLFGADAILRQVANSINKGESEATTNVKIPGLNWIGTDVKGIPKDVFLITDLTALKNFGKVDKDGTQYNTPNAVEYNKKLGQLNIIYYKTNFDGKTETDDAGKPIIDETKTQKLDEREWLFTKVKEAFPNKDAGGINSIISQALIKNNNSLYNISQLYKDPSATSQAPDVMIDKGGSSSLKTKYTLGGKTYSSADVEAAAKASNMSVSDYIKKAGLK